MYWDPLLKRLGWCWLQALVAAQNLNLSAVLVPHPLHFSPGLHVVALPHKGHSFTMLGPTESRSHFPDSSTKAQNGVVGPDSLSVHPETNYCHWGGGIHWLTSLRSSCLGHIDQECGKGGSPEKIRVVIIGRGDAGQNNKCPLKFINTVLTSVLTFWFEGKSKKKKPQPFLNALLEGRLWQSNTKRPFFSGMWFHD